MTGGASKKYRFEGFCYGLKSRKLYAMGRARSMPCKRSGADSDVGWLDDLRASERDDGE